MLTQEQIIRLQDIAFAACHSGAVYEARLIFDGLLTLNPQNFPARLGKAFSHVVVDDFEDAETLLRACLADKKDDVDAEALLGLCLVLSGRQDEARGLLAGKNYPQTPSGQLARELLAVLG